MTIAENEESREGLIPEPTRPILTAQQAERLKDCAGWIVTGGIACIMVAGLILLDVETEDKVPVMHSTVLAGMGLFAAVSGCVCCCVGGKIEEDSQPQSVVGMEV